MVDQYISEKFECQAVELTKLSEQIDSLEKTLNYRFQRLEGWFDQVEKNSDFRKKTFSFLKIATISTPIIITIIILL